MVAAALAAYHANNLVRIASGMGSLMYKDFPCIAMIGTAPVFYRILITQSLSENLHRPGQTLVVKKLIPPVPDMGRYIVDGMVPLENRKIVFKCWELFKMFVSHGVSVTFPLDLLALDEDGDEWF